MTTHPVASIVDDQVAGLIMPAGANIAAVLGLPRETLVVNLRRRMALTIKRDSKNLGWAVNAKRTATLIGALHTCAFLLFLIIGPATADHITGEQPTTAFAAK
ncbi:hypothetical protein [Pseudomonas sp. SCB32]|uniref:hypothetical protein n=1 Tax=Pseudomonas sp. SCB32 TaxID=2653853 RepID=UPI0012644006|nr:hypothetical protein [Pseudomonas sp. SCB32]